MKRKEKPRGKRIGMYRGVYFDSAEEHSMLQWLFELKDLGYIRLIRRAESYLLSEALVSSFVIPLKTTSRQGQQTLLQAHSYTPEFYIEWNQQRARDKLIWMIGEGTRFDKPFIAQTSREGKCFSVVEVKPSFDFHNSTRAFMLNMKWMWQKHGIFVNLIKKDKLFERTFTPREYLKTPTGKRRKVKWKIRTGQMFMHS